MANSAFHDLTLSGHHPVPHHPAPPHAPPTSPAPPPPPPSRCLPTCRLPSCRLPRRICTYRTSACGSDNPGSERSIYLLFLRWDLQTPVSAPPRWPP